MEQTQQEHFVPENPDMTKAEMQILPLDLAIRTAASGQSTGENVADGILFSDEATGKCAVALPFQLMKGQHITFTVSGRFESEADQSVRFCLADEALNSCSNTPFAEIRNDGTGAFCEKFELTANKPANALMISGSYVFTRFNRLVITSIEVEASPELIAGLDPSVPYEKAVLEDWYPQMLQDSWVSLGNNVRLKKVIERAQRGENITVATIGGSITEGAGATQYQNCYAYRIYDGIRKKYGTGNNVSFVNAGVGGTPSTFGWMRYQRDIVDRVKDDDGLPDIVVIEYSVNDGGEPTNHHCVESMVKQILSQPNEPVVILMFAVFITGYTLQAEFIPIGNTYDLMMISTKNGPFQLVGTKWTEKRFFYDQYHPTNLGHALMADCVLSAIEASLAAETSAQDIDLDVAPAYGTEYIGIRTIYKHSDHSDIALDAGSFSRDDAGSYQNLPVGRVCGENFHHSRLSGDQPLTFTATFKNLMIAYRTMSDASYGKADVYIDGRKYHTLNANTGSWGQSVVDLLYHADESAEHTVSIVMAEGNEDKKFTITCLGYTP